MTPLSRGRDMSRSSLEARLASRTRIGDAALCRRTPKGARKMSPPTISGRLEGRIHWYEHSSPAFRPPLPDGPAARRFPRANRGRHLAARRRHGQRQPGRSRGQRGPRRAGSTHPSASDMLHTDAHGRHLAPHGTLYLFEYVSVKTDKGVEGFEPGQEVHVVEAHRATHTLVVSDGRAQIEISPDQAHQRHGHRRHGPPQGPGRPGTASPRTSRPSRTAYNKFGEGGRRGHRQGCRARTTSNRPPPRRIVDNSIQRDQPDRAARRHATARRTSSAYNNYYGSNGYGYGNPYSYFDGGRLGDGIVNRQRQPAIQQRHGPVQRRDQPGQPRHGGRGQGRGPGR